MNNPIIMHINFAEQGQTLPEICQLAKRCGYDGIEFRNGMTEYDGKPEAYLEAVAAETERCGLKTIIFSVDTNLMDPDADQRKREVERSVKFCRLAMRRFQPTVFDAFSGNLKDPAVEYSKYDKQGSAYAKAEHYEWAAAGFKVLAACAAEEKFRFAFETHPGYLHDLPAATNKLIDMVGSDRLGINLDYANICAFPSALPMDKTFEACGDRLYYLHLKNILKVGGMMYDNAIRCGLADGIVNNRELLKRLIKINYQGPIAIEAPRAGDREYYAQQDITYLRTVMAELTPGSGKKQDSRKA